MPAWIIDVVLGILILGITYALSSEGLWGAALMFFNVLFSALIALNFYEPLAGLVAGLGDFATGYADTFCLMGLFVVSLVALRITTDMIAPAMVRFPAILYHLGRFAFGIITACVAVAFLILAFHTSPVHKKMFGVVDYKYKPPFKFGFDRHLLGFFQYTTGQTFANYGSDVTDPEFKDATIFDRRGSWLIDHQNARPYGKDTVPEPDAASTTEGAGGAGSPAAPGAPGGGRPPAGGAVGVDMPR